MKAAKSLTELAAELEAQKERRRDVVVDSSEITVLTSDRSGTEITLPDGTALVPQRLFHRQLGQTLGVRADLYDRLRHVHPMLFDQLVNGLLDRMPMENDGQRVRRMLRTYSDGGGIDGQGVARALLSDSYRRIDNIDLAEAVLPIIGNIHGAEVTDCELTETRMYIKVLVPTMQRSLKELVEPGHHEFLDPESPDYVQCGLVITNSEVGHGALSIEHMLFRLVCTNGLIVGKALRRSHVGRKVEVAEDYSIYSDETVKADDKALMMKVSDAVTHAVDEAKFDALARQFAATTASAQIEHPVEAMKVLTSKIGLTDTEGESVLTHLIQGRDLSQFGAINALTRAAQDVESYDRSVELEQIGSQVMGMPGAEWRELAAA
jgi:hypothetical protein